MPSDATLRFPPSIRARLQSAPWHVVVTGAGGWFGLATLEMLDDVFGPRLDQYVTAYARAEREIALRSGRKVRLRALSALSEQARPEGQVCVAHYAFLTRERIDGVGLEPYIASNRALTSFIEGEARRLRASGTFSTSSGAVYKRDGTLDDDLETNPYGVLKREEEAAFAGLRDIGTNAAVCRVFNVAGPFLNKDYALGSLIHAALHSPDLTIRARHRVYRSYAHVGDIVSVGFAIMTGLVTAPPEAYDTAGLDVVEVGDLAERVREVLGCPGKPIVRGAWNDMPDDRYVGRLEPFVDLAREAGVSLAPLASQILDTARFIAAREGHERGAARTVG